MNSQDCIEIRRLKVSTRIGVPDEERARPQQLLVTLRMWPSQGFAGLDDDISRTVNYHSVARQIATLADSRSRHLIETLALEIADHLLHHHPLERVAVTVEKHILPDTECVAVHLERGRMAVTRI